ncbi:MAG: ABC transporter substrate-binding protein [Sulfobacillus sp.]|nr:ABC transporter substrate-binding protein [Sulfobacillus sp.]
MDQPVLHQPMTRRKLLSTSLGLVGVGSLGSLLAACGVTAAPTVKSGTGLLASARSEGQLNVIALPPNWANYGAILAAFQKKYGLHINSQAPDDSSAEELQAVTTYRHNPALEPDAVDVGPSFAVMGKTSGLWAPYKNSHWDTIPTALKDPDGYWVGDYYGVIAFGANRNIVKTMPEDWSDLLKPEYQNMVSIDGDPRSASDAFMAVYAAALAFGGSLDNILPGIEFFAELKRRGNFVPVDNYPANIAKGTTPLAIKWDYLLLGYRQQFGQNPPLTVTIPRSGVIGGYYCQAISRYAFHPAAARLWEEFLYSDEGQLLYLAGFAHPVRYEDLVRRNLIPPALARELPPASAYEKARFPSVDQINRAAAVVQAEWGPRVIGA